MSATTTLKTRIVRVRYERKGDFYYSSSDDLAGLIVSARTMKELDDKIDDVIVRLYAASGVHVVVSRLDGPPKDHVQQWVAMPAEIARQQLEKADAARV